MPEIPRKPETNGEAARSEPSGVRLAINVLDITDSKRMLAEVRQMLFADKLDLNKAINVDTNRADEHAVVFTCDLKTAACICDTVRTHDRNAGDYPTRVYVRKAVAWVKLPGAATLTKVIDGKAFLNPEIFGDAAGKPEVKPPAATVFRRQGC